MSSFERPPTAEVIAIGDEMTGGARVDTNSAWIAARLEQLGLEVRFHAMAGDDLSDCVELFRTAARRSRIAVCTGGLGPTRDDLTRVAMANAAEVPLEFDPESMRHIESMFATGGRSMPERNRQQAMFPAGAKVIFNPQGTAPGVDQVFVDGENRCRVFALPGVPAEMKGMFDQHLVPAIGDEFGQDADSLIRCRVLKFFGCGESDMEQRLGNLIERGRVPRVGITVSAATISLRVTAIGRSEDECQCLLDTATEEIMSRAGEYYFGRGEHYELHHAIDQQWLRQSVRYGVIEIGHAAPLSHWFANLPRGGARVVENPDDRLFTSPGVTSGYRGGLQFPNRDGLLTATGQSTIQQACREFCQTMGVQRWIVVDGYPDLNLGSDSPVPAEDVRLLVIDRDYVERQTVRLGGHPSIIHARIGKAALAFARTCTAGT